MIDTFFFHLQHNFHKISTTLIKVIPVKQVPIYYFGYNKQMLKKLVQNQFCYFFKIFILP